MTTTEADLEHKRLEIEHAKSQENWSRNMKSSREYERDIARAKTERTKARITMVGILAAVLAVLGIVGGIVFSVMQAGERDNQRVQSCVASGAQWKQNPYTKDYECVRGGA